MSGLYFSKNSLSPYNKEPDTNILCARNSCSETNIGSVC